MDHRIPALVLASIAALTSVGARGQAVADPPRTEIDPFEHAIEQPEIDIFAPRLLPGAKRAQQREPIPTADAMPGILQGGGLSSWPRLYRDEALQVTGSVTGTFAVFKMRNNQFAPPPSLLPEGITINPGWGEFFLEAGLTARYALNPSVSVYGTFTYIETATRGHDNDTNDNTYHGLPELMNGGAIFRAGDGGPTLDLSYGQRDFTVGNGMLIWSGASNGTQRGANYLGPRAAWANAALAKVTWGELAVQAFYLKPNDAQAEETGTRVAGINFDWTPAGPVRLGAMYVHVPASWIVTRDGLDVYDVRVRWHPLAAVPHFWLQGEYVWERSTNVSANGWYVQANYNRQDLPWKPVVAVQWSSLSGDKPGTSRWEGFDPLYFGNGNPNWYPGKIGSTLFNNTNLQTASVNATFTPSDSQILQLWYLYFQAAVVNSPLDIPAANAPPPTGGGVPSRPLANELDVSWTYKFNKNVNVNLIGAYAAPGSGYKELYGGAGGSAAGWWFLGSQLNISY